MAERRLLAILGGPRRHGITGQMFDWAVEAALIQGWHVDSVVLYEKQIGFCRGCRACVHTEICVHKDDVQEIAELMKRCDMVVLAAPVYWANVPAAVKNLFDRLMGTAMGEKGAIPVPRLSGKRYVLLTACNTPFPFAWLCGQSRGITHVVHEFFKTAGVRCAGRFVCTGALKKKAPSPKLKQKLEYIFSK